MFSGGLVPQTPVLASALSAKPNSYPFGDPCLPKDLFSSLSSFPELHNFKIKRYRQRVDAGEPRNSYQMNPLKREHPTVPPSENGFNMKLYNSGSSNEVDSDNDEIMPKRIKTDQDVNSDENNYLAEKEAPNFEPSSPGDVESDDGGQGALYQSSGVNGNGLSSSSSSSSRRKCFHPQRQITANNGENDQDNGPNNDYNAGDDDDLSANNATNSSPSPVAENNAAKTAPVNPGANYILNMMNMMPNALGGLNAANGQKLQEMIEAHRRFPMHSHMEPPINKPFEAMPLEKIPSLAQLQHDQNQEIQQVFVQLCQTLKEKVNTVIDKVISDYRTTEARNHAERILKTVAATSEAQHQLNELKQQYSQQQQRLMAAAAASLLNPNSLYQPNLPTSGPSFNTPVMNNLLAAAAAVNQNNGSSSSMTNGIFPTPGQLPPGFSALGAQLANNQNLMRSSSAINDCTPIRKKRSKVTDSLRVNKSGIVRDSPSSMPTSERSSPLGSNFFAPTMVSHPLYNNSPFMKDERDESGENSDSFSDCGPYDNDCSKSSMLTPIHLRKAKLMFFYTRYPSSALLKSYFPDIRFNKNNTAQLVKWFSNFREFFYMQMEKFAKQALAEGITEREQIHVSEESEIFKTLNQHYNRNNLFPPPPSLRFVIEETLKEFFVALQHGRDAEPSWKKAIYKIIQQLDSAIPEHFKHSSFMNSLE